MSPGDPIAKEAANKIRELEQENAKLKTGHTPGSRDDVAVQAAAEMSKKGRDGAYLEVEAKDLIGAIKDGSLRTSKIVTLKGYRMELSSPEQVKAFTDVVEHWMSLQGATGLNDEQASFSAVREVFVRGLLDIDKMKKGVD